MYSIQNENANFWGNKMRKTKLKIQFLKSRRECLYATPATPHHPRPSPNLRTECATTYVGIL